MSSVEEVRERWTYTDQYGERRTIGIDAAEHYLTDAATDIAYLLEIADAAREAEKRLRILRTNRGMTVMEATGPDSAVRKEYRAWEGEVSEILAGLREALEPDHA